MKRSVCAAALAAALVGLPTIGTAQDVKNQFDVGSKFLSGALLVGAEVDGGFGIGGSFEVGIAEIAGQVRLGVGGSVGVLRNDYDEFLDDVSRTVVPVLAFVHGHYQLPQVPQLDLFAGAAVGLQSTSLSFSGGGSSSSVDPAIGLQSGARYEFAPRLMGMAQLAVGTNLPFLSLGITFKL